MVWEWSEHSYWSVMWYFACDAASISSLWVSGRCSACPPGSMSFSAITGTQGYPSDPLSDPPRRSPSPPLPTCQALASLNKCCILCPLPLLMLSSLTFSAVSRCESATVTPAVTLTLYFTFAFFCYLHVPGPAIPRKYLNIFRKAQNFPTVDWITTQVIGKLFIVWYKPSKDSSCPSAP